MKLDELLRVGAVLLSTIGMCGFVGCSDSGKGEAPPAKKPQARNAEQTAAPHAEPKTTQSPPAAPGRRTHRPNENPLVPGVDPDLILAAIPENAGAWKRTEATGHTDDNASHSAGAVATLVRGEAKVDVRVTDTIHSRPCAQPTTGSAAGTRKDGMSFRRFTIKKRAAMLTSYEQVMSVMMCVADYCQIEVSATGIPEADLLQAAAAIDLDALEKACTRDDIPAPP